MSNVRSALSGNSVYALCQFGMLSVLALLTDTSEVGRYALALAITAPVFLFASLKLRQVQVTDARNEFSFGEYLGQRLLTSAVAITVVMGAVPALGVDSRTTATVAGVTVFKSLESIIDILYGAMQRREQLHLVASSQMLRGIGGLVVFASAVWLTGRVEFAVGALAAFTVFHVLMTFYNLRKVAVHLTPAFSWRTFRRLTWLALPLGLALAIASLSVNVPRYFIEAQGGVSELGIFAALAYFVTVTGMIMNSLVEAASPRLANLFAAREYKQFRVTVKKLVMIGASIGIVGFVGVVIFGEPILNLVFGEEYAARNDVLLVMMAGCAVLYSTMFLGTAVNAMRRFAVQLPINASVFVTVLAVSAMAVPKWGIMGGAVAMAAGEIVALVFYVGLYFDVILPATATATPTAAAPRAITRAKRHGYVPRHMTSIGRCSRQPPDLRLRQKPR